MILGLADYFIDLFVIEETLESNASVCTIHFAVKPAKAESGIPCHCDNQRLASLLA
jgi:hypothetical protein